VLVEDTKDPYKLALGADARLQYDLTKDTSNFDYWIYKSICNKADGSDLGFIPAKAGFKAFI
jgi:hypothetical protein